VRVHCQRRPTTEPTTIVYEDRPTSTALIDLRQPSQQEEQGTQVKRLTDAELVAAYDRKDWTLLWEQALTLVRPTISSLNRSGCTFHYDDDTLQQGSLLVGEIVRRWQPIEGAFTTWVMAKLGWRLRSWQRRELQQTGMFEGDDEDEETQPRRESRLAQSSYEEAPLGFAGPLEEAIRLQERAAVMTALDQLPAHERDALLSVYGIDGLGGMTVEEYALAAGVSRRGAFNTVDQARRRMMLKLRSA
jgi:RNA polymerase sigma factor (sigma-70 family)